MHGIILSSQHMPEKHKEQRKRGRLCDAYPLEKKEMSRID